MDGLTPGDGGQRHLALERSAPEGGEPVADLVGGDEPSGRQFHEGGEGGLPVVAVFAVGIKRRAAALAQGNTREREREREREGEREREQLGGPTVR